MSFTAKWGGDAVNRSNQGVRRFWKWDHSAALALHKINIGAAGASSQRVGLINALKAALGHSPMFAYLLMMAVRLVELHRVRKPTGSRFLHGAPDREPLSENYSGRRLRAQTVPQRDCAALSALDGEVKKTAENAQI